MKNKVLTSLVLSGLFLTGCAYKAPELAPKRVVKFSGPVVPYKAEDKLFFKIVVEKDKKNNKVENISTYMGEIDLNKNKEKDVDFIYQQLTKVSYVATTMIDKDGKYEELRDEVITGLSFDVNEKEADENNFKEKELIIKLNKIVELKTFKIKNAYGKDESIVTPNLVNLEEKIALPIKYFEMTRFLNSGDEKIIVKIYINNQKSLLSTN